MDIDPLDVYAMGQRHQQAKQLNELNKELRRQKKTEPRGPKCPVCGGVLPGEYRKCKHCQADLSWIEGRVCELGQEQYLRDTIAAEARERKQRSTKCKNCGKGILKSTAAKNRGLCMSCGPGRIQKRRRLVIAALSAALSVAVFFYMLLK